MKKYMYYPILVPVPDDVGQSVLEKIFPIRSNIFAPIRTTYIVCGQKVGTGLSISLDRLHYRKTFSIGNVNI